MFENGTLQADNLQAGLSEMISQLLLQLDAFVPLIMLCVGGSVLWMILRRGTVQSGESIEVSDIAEVGIDELYDPTGRYRLMDFPKTLSGESEPSGGYEDDPIDIMPRKGGGYNVLDGMHRVGRRYRKGGRRIKARRRQY